MTDVFPQLAQALSDRYRLERELGEGGMATVYLAEDLKHRRRVAIKVLRPELAAVIGADRFLKEIETTASLQHPHILPLLDSGRTGGQADRRDDFLYYVMPFVEGESLRDRLSREKQLPVEDAVRITREVASALDYAHRHGVIHRDIKPENVLLHDGSALVADFGIALAASKAGGTRMTETGMSLGTPHYMSPEQAMGEREITARSDVYALGCVAYEMLTGDPPFTGSTAQAIVARVVTEQPRAITTQRRTVPPHVEAAVLTALEKLPADRFASAAEFAEALDGKGGGRYGGAAVRTTRAAALAPYRPTARLLIGIAILATGFALWGWFRPHPAPPTTRQRVVLWQHPLDDFLSPGILRAPTQAAIAPDGSVIVFSDSSGPAKPLMRKRRHEPRPEPLAGTEGGISPFFSPDGRWVGYFMEDGQLRKVPVEGGAPITLNRATNPIYPSGAWLDDGTIVFLGNDRALARIPAEGGTPREFGPDRTIVAAVSPLPGSRGVLITVCAGNCAAESNVMVYDFAADSARLLVPNAAGAWYAPTGHLLYTDREGGLYAAGFDARRLAMTSGVVPVIEGVAPTSFAISASGTVLYTVGTGVLRKSQLMWVSRDGRAEPLDSSWTAVFDYPALSPDGKSLAVSVREGTTQLWVRRSDGTRQKLTQMGLVSWRPGWHPDGKSLAFLSNADRQSGYDTYDAFVVPGDGSAPPTRLVRHSFGLWEAEFSPDAQWLVVRADEGGGRGVIRARRLGGDTTLVPLVMNESRNNQIAISPDGRWMAYASDATGDREVYVTPFPAAGSVHLVSRGGGIEPRWSRNARELFFRTGDQLMVVDVRPGPTFSASNPRPLFSVAGYRSARNRQQYDVAPDGQHFVMIREPEREAVGTVIYVEHWFEELKGKVK